MSDRSTQLYKKAEALEEKANRLRNIADNIDSNNTISDKELNINLNNERFGISPADCFLARENHLLMDEIFMIIRRFALTGDPLCEKIIEGYEENPALKLVFNEDIVKKLIMRQMTEKEYLGYLNGDLPITSKDYDKIYLSKNKLIYCGN